MERINNNVQPEHVVDNTDSGVDLLDDKPEFVKKIESFDVHDLKPENIEFMNSIIQNTFKDYFPVDPELVDQIPSRMNLVSAEEYTRQRNIRIKDLIQKGIKPEIAKSAIPIEYRGISNSTLEQINDNIILRMYLKADKLKRYKEYITIVQVENGRIVVPEIILPERLKRKEKNYGGIEI